MNLKNCLLKLTELLFYGGQLQSNSNSITVKVLSDLFTLQNPVLLGERHGRVVKADYLLNKRSRVRCQHILDS